MSKFAGKTISRVWGKAEFQKMRRDIKPQGFDVAKTSDGCGYELRLKDGRLLLKAMQGRNGYLVRQVSGLFGL